MYLCAALRNLVIDIGNTRIKTAVFEGQALLHRATGVSFTGAELLAHAIEFDVKRAIFSTVTDIDEALFLPLRSFCEVLEFNHQTPLPFTNAYRTPLTLGKDRLAAVAGAAALFPGSHCVVIDSGTCIKYEVLTADGRYLGGNIAPGLRMRTQAMHHFTARLPEVETYLPEKVIGDSTESALQNGAFRGLLLEVEGFVALFQQDLGPHPVQVIFSGGDAPFLAAHLAIERQKIIQDLTLIGLNSILERI